MTKFIHVQSFLSPSFHTLIYCFFCDVRWILIANVHFTGSVFLSLRCLFAIHSQSSSMTRFRSHTNWCVLGKESSKGSFSFHKSILAVSWVRVYSLMNMFAEWSSRISDSIEAKCQLRNTSSGCNRKKFFYCSISCTYEFYRLFNRFCLFWKIFIKLLSLASPMNRPVSLWMKSITRCHTICVRLRWIA